MAWHTIQFYTPQNRHSWISTTSNKENRPFLIPFLCDVNFYYFYLSMADRAAPALFFHNIMLHAVIEYMCVTRTTIDLLNSLLFVRLYVTPKCAEKVHKAKKQWRHNTIRRLQSNLNAFLLWYFNEMVHGTLSYWKQYNTTHSVTITQLLWNTFDKVGREKSFLVACHSIVILIRDNVTFWLYWFMINRDKSYQFPIWSIFGSYCLDVTQLYRSKYICFITEQMSRSSATRYHKRGAWQRKQIFS
jgi:hypothetical protein